MLHKQEQKKNASFNMRAALLNILSDGDFHSGEKLGQQLGVSRAAISKHMKIIESWGLDIFKVTGKGYRLATPLLLLQPSQLFEALGENNVSLFTSIDSTNQWLLDRIGTVEEGHFCFAEHQTSGKGRRGRQWLSPVGASLMFSLYWQMPDGMAAAMGVSLVVGVAVAETLHRLGLIDVRLKWPNDLYAQDKKLAGILVEMTGQAGGIAHLVIGVGINFDIPQHVRSEIDQPIVDLSELAESSHMQPLNKTHVALELARSIRKALEQHRDQGTESFIERWNQFDNYKDRPITLLLGENRVTGIAQGINKQGALCLETDGGLKTFVGGEISLRGQHAIAD